MEIAVTNLQFANALLPMPDSVTFIDQYAFTGCVSLTSIVIPEGVTSVGAWLFNGCKALTSVTLPETLTVISNYMFYNCSSLSQIVVPAEVTGIGINAFYNSGVTSVVFEQPSGWMAGNISFEASTLENAATAATYLTITYCAQLWIRSI